MIKSFRLSRRQRLNDFFKSQNFSFHFHKNVAGAHVERNEGTSDLGMDTSSVGGRGQETEFGAVKGVGSLRAMFLTCPCGFLSHPVLLCLGCCLTCVLVSNCLCPLATCGF